MALNSYDEILTNDNDNTVFESETSETEYTRKQKFTIVGWSSNCQGTTIYATDDSDYSGVVHTIYNIPHEYMNLCKSLRKGYKLVLYADEKGQYDKIIIDGDILYDRINMRRGK